MGAVHKLKGLVGSNGREAECYSAVTDLCTSPDGSLVVVAVQSFQRILLLKCVLSARTLSLVKMVSIGGGTLFPTSLRMCSSTGLFWIITGVSNLRGFESPSLARVKVIFGFKESNSDPDQNEHHELEDNETPGGAKLLEKLQGSLSYGEQVFFLAAAEAVKTAMSSLLIKKQHS